jgi:predicted outer membrane repeat protein
MSVAYPSNSNKYDGASCADGGICNGLCSLDSNCIGYTLGDWKIAWAEYYGTAAVGGGVVYNWGRGTYQAWVDGTQTTAMGTPTKIPGITNAVDVAIHSSGGCALLSDKTVSCWGKNKYTGNGGTDTTIKPPTIVAGLTDVVALKGRGQTYCALLSDKNLKCWGGAGNGEMGVGNSNHQPIPILAFGSNGDIEDFDIGYGHGCVIYTGGALKCAGYNYYGQVGMGGNGVSYNSFHSPTQVKKWGNSDATDAVSIHCGYQTSCYVSTDGKLRCWGNGGYAVGWAGNDPTTIATPISSSMDNPTWVTLGRYGGCAGVSNGDVYCWGGNSGYDTGDSYPKLTTFTGMVQQGGDSNVFVSEGGQVRSSGTGSAGELGHGETVTRSGWNNNKLVLLPNAGGSYGPLVNGTGNSKQKGAITCTACPSGTTLPVKGEPGLGLGSFCTRDTACDQNEYVNVTHGCQTCAGNFNDLGDTTVGQCDDPEKCLVNEHVKTTFDSDTETSYSGSACTSTGDCVTKCHGDAACAGYTEGEFTIDMAYHYGGMCVLSSSGKARCLGEAAGYRLGNQNQGSTDTLTFVDVDNIDGSSDDKFAIAIAGAYHGHLALMRDGSVMSWGCYSGTGLGGSCYWPDYLKKDSVKITNAIKIAHIYHACAILDTGEMLCWGSNYLGEVNTQRGSEKYGPVTAGGTSSWKMDGSTDERSVVDVALGDYLTCALMKDGKLRCWGNNGYGQTGQGTVNPSPYNYETSPSNNEATGIDGQTPASTVVKMKNGKEHMCVLMGDGSLKCWGRGTYGQFCNEDLADQHSPVTVFAGESIKDFTTGKVETCILTTVGELKCCGKGRIVGGGTNAPITTTPATIAGISNGIAIYSDPMDSIGKMCVLMEDRSMKCWGQNYQGGLGIGSSSPQYNPVSNSDVLNLQTYSANYGALVAGSGNSYTKNIACQACGAGYTNAAMDEVTLQVDTPCDFTPCLENFSVKSGACTACAAGATRVAGDADHLVDTYCICVENQYVSSGFCTACATGTNPAGDVGPANTYCNCGVNEKVTGGACVACTSGASRAAGDDLGAGDTYCTCGVNQHIVSNVCTECPSGSTRAAGDDASGSNTECLIAPCASGYRVKDNACVACPAGMTNDAGDDNANGPNTYCDSSTVCGEDEYVSNHVCTTCAAGKVTPYGSNPAGEDTVCTWGMCERDYYVDSSKNCKKCPAGAYKNPTSRQYTSTTCSASTSSRYCKENERVAFLYNGQDGTQFANSNGYGDPFTDIYLAEEACTWDPSCTAIVYQKEYTSSTTMEVLTDEFTSSTENILELNPVYITQSNLGQFMRPILHNGKYYTLGYGNVNHGVAYSNNMQSVYEMDLAGRTYEKRTATNYPTEAFAGFAVSRYNEKVFICGNGDKKLHVLNLNTMAWTKDAATNEGPECGPGNINFEVIGNTLYAIDSYYSGTTIWKMSVSSNTYTWGASSTHYTSRHKDDTTISNLMYQTSIVYKQKIYLLGGCAGSSCNDRYINIYDPATDTVDWRKMSSFLTSVSYDGHLDYVKAGMMQAGSLLIENSLYLYGGTYTINPTGYSQDFVVIDLNTFELYRGTGGSYDLDLGGSTNAGYSGIKMVYMEEENKIYTWGGSYGSGSYAKRNIVRMTPQFRKFYLADSSSTPNQHLYCSFSKSTSTGVHAKNCKICRGDSVHPAYTTSMAYSDYSNCTFSDCAVNQGSSGGSCFDCPTGKVRNPPISPATDNICTIPPCAADEKVIKDYKTTPVFYGGNDCTSATDCEVKCADDSSCEGYSALSAMDFVNGVNVIKPLEGMCRKAITQAECQSYATAQGKTFSSTTHYACGCSEHSGNIYYNAPAPNCVWQTYNGYHVICYEAPTVKYTGNSCSNFDDCLTKCKADSSCQGISRGVSTGGNYGTYDPYTNPGDCRSFGSWSGGGSSSAAFGCIKVGSSYRWNDGGDPSITNQISVNGQTYTPIAANGQWTYGTATTAAADLSIAYAPTKYSYGTETTASGIAPSWTSKTNVNAGYKCSACLAPSTNEAGDTDLNGETVCDWGLCGQDQRASNKACVACDAGTFNFAGDPAAIDSTCDDPDTCVDNEYSVMTGMGIERISGYIGSANALGMSRDGTKVIVVMPQGVKVSSDSGATFSTVSFSWFCSSCNYYRDVAMSANGSVVAVAQQGNTIHVSRNGGLTSADWQSPHGGYASGNWKSYYTVAMSADGSIIVGGVNNAGEIALSTNTGNTWSHVNNADFGTSGKRIAVAKHNGNMVIIIAGQNGKVMRSTDGSSWTESTVSNPGGLAASTLDNWYAATISDDGKYVVIANDKYLYVSSDFGVTFAQDTSIGSHTSNWFNKLTSSADGKEVYAAMYPEELYHSSNYGATWQSLGNDFSYASIQLKNDGTLYAGRQGYFDKGIPSYACSACPSSGTRTGERIATEPFGCTFGTCNANERVVNYACVACDAGTFNDAGDDAGAGDTTCDDAEVCPANHYGLAGYSIVTSGTTGFTRAECDAYYQHLLIAYPLADYADYDTTTKANGCIQTSTPNNAQGAYSLRFNTIGTGACASNFNCVVVGTPSCTACTNSGTNAGGKVDSGLVCVYPDCQTDQYSTGNGQCLTCPVGRFMSTPINPSTAAECSCVADQYVRDYLADSTKKYAGTSCTDLTDCNTKCSADGACEGYTNLGPQTIGWGVSGKGGDVPALGSFVEIVSTSEAFAALKSDGSVQVWGSIYYGGADPGITSGVQKIYSNPVAFAALKTDGSVTTWGDTGRGGADPNIGAGSGITEIFSNWFAFAALKSDGSVTAWGNTGKGGAAPSITNVVTIVPGTRTFAALKSDGSVTTWGDSSYGGGTSITSDVVEIVATEYSFAALKTDGSVQAWGYAVTGGSDPSITCCVTKIFSNDHAFAALKTDGSVQVWGDPSYGGSDPNIGAGSGVTKIFSNRGAFAALKSDGSVQVWGDSWGGGSDPNIGAGSGVTKIFSNWYAFAALKDDGSVKAWGAASYGGCDSGTAAYHTCKPAGLTDVTDIFSTKVTFAALKSDGSVVAWGQSVDAGGQAAPAGVTPAITGVVTDIYSNDFAYVAVTGPVFAYGPLVAGTGGSYTEDGSCQSCPSGFTNAAGDDPNGAGTTCDFTPCAINHYVDNNVCTACTGGQFSAGGLVTSCSGVEYCAVNQKVSAGGTASWSTRKHSSSWTAIASSADGTKLVAGEHNGNIWTSTDSGATWTSRASSQSWKSITSSTDGTKLAATTGNHIWTSSDSGETWTEVTSAGSKTWKGIDSSADGTTVVAAASSSTGEKIYISTNSGSTWAVAGDSEAQKWTDVAVSADGTKMAAVHQTVTNYGGKIWLSTDSGATWVADNKNAGGYDITFTYKTLARVSMSADGTKIAVAVNSDYIYVSTDSGGAWAAKASTQYWWGLAMSSDGTKMAAAVYNGKVWVSIDDGDTWNEESSLTSGKFDDIALSDDGSMLAVVQADGGNIHTLAPGKSCVNCPAGQQNALGIATDKSGADGTCVAASCVANQYSDGSICQNCAQHTGANSVGLDPSAGVTACVPTTCGNDQYVESNVCKLCDSKAYRLAGDQVFGGDTHCFCRDHHKVINKACVACEVGSNNPNLCYSGLQNHYCVCDANYHVVSNLCTACPGAATRAAGDYAGNADTHCTCGEDQHVVSNACVACPAGTKRPAGDDSSGADTPCSCQENEHVKNVTNVLQCSACPTGSLRAAGDLVANGETVCACPENFRVSICSDTNKLTEIGCLYEEVTSGAFLLDSNPNYVDKTECGAWASSNGYTFNGDLDNLANPAGCFRHVQSDAVFFNNADQGSCSGTCGLNNNVDKNCIQKSSNTWSNTVGHCLACVAGTRAAGDDPLAGDTHCACNENHHVASNVCTTCPSDSTRAAGDDASGDDTKCACDENFKVSTGSCSACPANTELAAGGDLAGDDTVCTCKENFYSNGGGSCSACGSGAVIASGSDPAAASVCTCDAGYELNGASCSACGSKEESIAGGACLCKDLHHVSGGACTACAAGSTHPAGDDKTVDTVCTNTLCAENERVQNNVCVPCIPGKLRAADDDATGANSACAYQGTQHEITAVGAYAFRIDTLANNAALTIRVGETHTFIRGTGGDPFRIVTAEDCAGKGCDLGQYSELPSSSLGMDDSEKDTTVTVFTPTLAGLHYYMSTTTPYRKGRIYVKYELCTITYPETILAQGCELSGEITLSGPLTIKFALARLRAQDGAVPQITAASGARHFTVSGGHKLTLENIDLNGGRGSEGGSILVDNGEIDANNVKFTDNVASSKGGAIRVKNAASKLSLNNILFADNQGSEGGALSIQDDLTQKVEIHNSDFKNNRASSGHGGAISTAGEVNITITNFEDNTANAGEGGAISATKDVTLTGSSFKRNKALKGGAMRASGIKVEMSNMVIEANEAVEEGGAFNAENSEFDVRTSTITGNKAKRGAAFRSRSTGCTTNCKKLRIRSSSLENNEATTAGGAVDFDGDANAEPQFWVQDSTLSGNKAAGQSSDFKKRGSKVKIKAIDSVIGNIDGGAVDSTCEAGQCGGRAHSTCASGTVGSKCECDGTSRHLDGVECKEHKACTGLDLDVEIRGPDKSHNRLCGTKDIAEITHKLDAKGKELANMIEAKLVSEGVAADQAYALAVEVFGEVNKCE